MGCTILGQPPRRDAVSFEPGRGSVGGGPEPMREVEVEVARAALGAPAEQKRVQKLRSKPLAPPTLPTFSPELRGNCR
jgi:hypothetical protein